MTVVGVGTAVDADVAVDTSVAVPAMLRWHEAHRVCRGAAAGAAIPAHAALESFSVLTRLPAPHRLGAADARVLVVESYPGTRVLDLSGTAQRSLVALLVDRGVTGGAVYDGLIALTVRESGLLLLTRDRRAVSTYEALDVPYEVVG